MGSANVAVSWGDSEFSAEPRAEHHRAGSRRATGERLLSAQDSVFCTVNWEEFSPHLVRRDLTETRWDRW